MKPNCNDFIKFKTIPKDPKNPEGGTLEVAETGPNRIDEDACKKAQNDWSQRHSSAAQNQKPSDPKQLTPEMKQDIEMQKFQADTGTGTAASINRQLYNQARGEYVDQVNQYIGSQAGGKTASQIRGSGTAKNPLTGTSGDGNQAIITPPPGVNNGGTGAYYDSYNPNAFSGANYAPANGGASNGSTPQNKVGISGSNTQPPEMPNPFF
jgi:hypothetical protein